MARIPPLPPREWPAEMRQALAAIDPVTRGLPAPDLTRRPSGRDVLASLAHHPDLARAFMVLNGHVLLDSTLTTRQLEILALRVAARRASPYLWAQHLFAGREAGLTDEEIARVAFGPKAPFLVPLERALLCAVDDLVDDGSLSDRTWESLAAELDVRQLLDVIVTVGCYATMASFMTSLDLEPDPRIPDLLAGG
ncbi:carboxymuconolactone decarboxylase family protein [Frankia sp. AgB1.9]|uniref:carboxymuconolactone decarboxylase family protein n=1 Tax=unclassified Frankia TaxID=2632575 RepID=UPI00193359E5|nr:MULTISPECIES: carboxymuconolactone decarboxylase family protein [unclassified Frankia]MBL7493255.1 carboxymuconolactone decarboxylase family protein [Frankia sp. AgW1.1]MBL7547258.1 carboxymuconolactone decarboxylase family protein [Frankia sp. AgB1.9]MBL7618142.1 carboxymuconolactone decarboxylase family protein [Frankia sp. AgB1.8]